MKKNLLFSMLAAVVLTLGFAACSNDDNNSGKSEMSMMVVPYGVVPEIVLHVLITILVSVFYNKTTSPPLSQCLRGRCF